MGEGKMTNRKQRRIIMENNKIALFKGRKILRTLHHNEWWFSVIDVVAALTYSDNPRDYWYKMKIRVKDEDGSELSTFCRQLKLVFVVENDLALAT
jgi:prophage antirepressor-like protein